MPRVPDRTWFDPVLGAQLSTGADAALEAVGFPGGDLATDIETPGLDNSFTINCVTMAWRADGKLRSVLLDPARDPRHADLVRLMYGRAARIILHNAAFDVPPLQHAGLLTPDQISRVVDTLLLARFAIPDTFVPKNLAALSSRFLGYADFADGMKRAFAAAGYRTIQAGFEGLDIGSPIYRFGAMADTVATLQLEPVLRQLALDWTLDHPFSTHGATTRDAAVATLEKQERVNRVMLRISARGLAVDMDYLDRYREQVEAERQKHLAALAAVGLEGGSGKGGKMVDYLDSIGELPDAWPRTPTGKLKATKELLEGLDHPLAHAQRQLAVSDKVTGYLEKVARQAAVTGRCHPQVGVLGASATGRMSYGVPELQQFPADARPIIGDDGQGLTSLDWSQIEPVTMANMAGDTAFLEPFEGGADLYEPIQRAAGIDRPTAKVVLLAAMYGQGIPKLARTIGHTEESAAQIRRQMFAAMPRCGKWMSRVVDIAAQHRRIITAGGRILSVDPGFEYKAVNYCIQGSAYDVLAHTIVTLDERGLADHLHLAMHDEVVVDSEIAFEAERIMRTPPPFLEAWAGRTPVLRTDRADMGHSWLKV